MYSNVNKIAVWSNSRRHTPARGSMRLDVNVQKVFVSCAGCVRVSVESQDGERQR